MAKKWEIYWQLFVQFFQIELITIQQQDHKRKNSHEDDSSKFMSGKFVMIS